ncbi:MAG: bifunctional diaminohydroxyphosphoribosylaminopyrimidine deaminase/5-amino-6-(5-phosphoribosylamino)uracil reductase RibD, partial [Candidatus Omnitrophota bacterium]
MNSDNRFMRLALRLARRAQGQTSPNPLVGAVVVKNGKIVGQGYHKAAGRAHAEVVALDQAGSLSRGASLYVTLEPCCHWGRTGPCVDRIKDSGVREVFFAMQDPNPLNNGQGAEYLRRQGIKTHGGILEEEAKKLNPAYIKYITTKIPYVTVKIAQSLDGKIASVSGDSRWITSEPARGFAHKLRSQSDAVLVGINTALRDDPLLNCRLGDTAGKQHPKKVIVDTRLKIRPQLRIFSPDSPAEVIIAATKLAPRQKITYFSRRARVLIVRHKENKVVLKDLMRKLADLEITNVLIEGGSEIIASALQEKLVDRMIVFIAPKLVGGRTAPSAVGGQ